MPELGNMDNVLLDDEMEERRRTAEEAVRRLIEWAETQPPEMFED